MITALLGGSPRAEKVLPYVEYLGAKLSRDILLVRVASTGAAHTSYSAALLQSGSVDLDERIQEKDEVYLEQTANRFRANGLTVRWRLLEGSPAHAVVDMAHETPNEMIAMTAHGRSGIMHWILGSVAEAVIRASGDPVLVIPPDDHT